MRPNTFGENPKCTQHIVDLARLMQQKYAGWYYVLPWLSWFAGIMKHHGSLDELESWDTMVLLYGCVSKTPANTKNEHFH